MKYQIKPDKGDIAAWEELCTWLSKQNMHAAYADVTPDFPHKKLIRSELKYIKQRKWLKDNGYQLVFWHSGFGWQLRKDWELKIERLKENSKGE